MQASEPERSVRQEVSLFAALEAKCGHMRPSPSQAAAYLPCGSPSIQVADVIMYRMARLSAYFNTQPRDYWTAAQSPDAALCRLVVASPLPSLVRTQVRRERLDASVLGCCYGIARTRAPPTPHSRSNGATASDNRKEKPTHTRSDGDAAMRDGSTTVRQSKQHEMRE